MGETPSRLESEILICVASTADLIPGRINRHPPLIDVNLDPHVIAERGFSLDVDQPDGDARGDINGAAHRRRQNRSAPCSRPHASRATSLAAAKVIAKVLRRDVLVNPAVDSLGLLPGIRHALRGSERQAVEPAGRRTSPGRWTS